MRGRGRKERDKINGGGGKMDGEKEKDKWGMDGGG